MCIRDRFPLVPDDPLEPLLPLVPDDPLFPLVPDEPLVPLDPLDPLVPLEPAFPVRLKLAARSAPFAGRVPLMYDTGIL